MKALGMIEVYGYLTAVEALDSALKAANVTRLDVVKVRGGLVTVLVEGDVGAVKAAMDASAAAAERIGTVVSVHVIPRPASDVERMLKGPGGGPKTEPPETEPEEPGKSEPKEPEPEGPEPEERKDEEPEAEPPEADLEPETPEPEPEPEAPEPEKPAQAAMPEPAEPERKPEAGKAAAVTPEEMKAMSVDGLRRLARELEIPSMTRAEIRYAKKQELIQKITEFIDS